MRKKISFVILDVEMPGMPGSKVFDRLRDIDPDVKILITSGYGQEYLESHLHRKLPRRLQKKASGYTHAPHPHG